MSPGRLLLRRAFFALLIVTGALVLAIAFVAFVPPLQAVRHADWPAVAPVRPRENAWEPYLRGLFDLAREPQPRWTITATDLPAFTADHLAYLDRHPAALSALHEGTQRPRARFFTQAMTGSTPQPHPLAVRGLAQIAAAQAHRLRLFGRDEEAWPLEIDAYLFGADVAEPETGLVTALGAVGCRRSAARGLFRALARPSLATDSDIALARGVARADARMPSPYQVAAAEWGVIGRTVETYYLDDQLPGLPQRPDTRPALQARALRLRVLDSFFRQHRALLEELRHPLAAWDFATLAAFDRTRRPVPSVWRWPFFIESTAGEIVRGVVYPIGQPARLLYVDYANGCALQALASLRVYRAVHGGWPGDLASAMSTTGLPVPRDPVTRADVRYRVDASGPVLWLVGFDGRDDGGVRDYDDKSQSNVLAGTDLVYRMGEVPSILR